MIPCIDLQDGKAVQLVHGRKRALEVEDVMGLLKRFRRHPWLNVIDLDAAIGTGANEEWVKKLCRAARRDYGMRVRVGGGVRTVARAKELVKLGAAQVIVGSAAFRDGAVDAKFLRRLRKAIGRKRIVVALDTLRGRIAVRGWRIRLSLRPAEVLEDNTNAWSGDHCMDYTQVPGVLLSNRRIAADGYALTDIAPTILGEFGIAKTDGMMGHSIFAGK